MKKTGAVSYNLNIKVLILTVMSSSIFFKYFSNNLFG